ncbi:hypothetical protein RJ639_006950 [Escallonia herrerae]|uniref:Beta-1,3-glucanase n=1 Tax=Escallonia herrerae TaxID=1293975 RepID=A0AA89AVT5_9ASTE|nr:hypothetical protein RJ639_006950 [Escallonia herrerae]
MKAKVGFEKRSSFVEQETFQWIELVTHFGTPDQNLISSTGVHLKDLNQTKILQSYDRYRVAILGEENSTVESNSNHVGKQGSRPKDSARGTGRVQCPPMMRAMILHVIIVVTDITRLLTSNNKVCNLLTIPLLLQLDIALPFINIPITLGSNSRLLLAINSPFVTGVVRKIVLAVVTCNNNICILLTLISSAPAAAAPIGICYGIVANNLPPPSDVVNLLKSNEISRVRLFNADPEALKPFSGTGIQLMIGVPNEILPSLASSPITTSIEWFQSNIFAYISPNQIRYLAVGNEVFLKDPFYTPHVVPAMANLRQALGLDESIKLSSSHAASILSNSYPPSAGAFDPNIRPVMVPLLQFLRDSGSPLMVNVYPYFSYVNNPQYVWLDYALFRSQEAERDQNLVYDNLFDATVDAFVYAMEREGYGGIPVVVTETGWPTGRRRGDKCRERVGSQWECCEKGVEQCWDT